MTSLGCRRLSTFTQSSAALIVYRRCLTTSAKSTQAPPLRILFAGTDHFSATSLKALHLEQQKNKSLIKSIDVLCREDALVGRARKTIREVPVKELAKSLNLPTHEVKRRGGLRDWQFPDRPEDDAINLIIAVSFGSLIPARLLEAVEYGGLNVHPSLLPMYRGAAPIYHTLMNRTPITGVTVQTLHPQFFDHGEILIQTNPPLHVPPKTSYQKLHDALAVHGATMLIETLRNRLYIPPITPIKNSYVPSEAPKISLKETHCDWLSWTAEEVERRAGAVGTLWTKLGRLERDELEMRKKVILTDISILEFEPAQDLPPGQFQYIKDGWHDVMAVRCKEGWVNVGGVKVEGKSLVHGGEWVRSLQDRGAGKRFYIQKW